MRRSALALVAVAALVSTATPARADAPITNGLICSFATIIDPTAEEGVQSGQLEGGPVLFTTGTSGNEPQQGTLVCRIQVEDAFTADHDGGSGPTVSGHTNAAGVAVAVPQIISIQRTGTQNVFLCSEFVDDASGITYYWDDDLSEWSTLSTVHCGLSVTGDDGSGPSDLEILIDSIICPVLALVFPPEGDIGGIWDCPPYDYDDQGPQVLRWVQWAKDSVPI